MSFLPTLAFAMVAASAALQALFLFRRDGGKDPASHWILLAASAALLAAVVDRSLAIGFPALTGTYESLVFYAILLCLLCAAYRLQRRVPFSAPVQFGASVAALALLAVASSPLAPKEPLAPIPALRSGWLVAHVALSFVGEAFFVASFAASIAFLLSRDEARRADLDRITYTAIAAGYPVFTAGALVFGAVWAEQAWGAWWSWDPKETWALATWLVYTFYLHYRLIRKKAGVVPAWISVAGFACTLFTFFGVNFLLSGLHSYG
jgi:ABC-type transport system involved in cytochrome c biogenesis permease subunit